MADDHYQSRLLYWQKLFETALHSDRIAADIGIYCLKVLLVVTGGTIVALLSFLTSDSTGASATLKIIAGSLDEFLWSLLLAMGASGIAYFYQGFVTMNRWEQLDVSSEEPSDKKDKNIKLPMLAMHATKWLMILLSLLSFAIFCYASFGLVGDFQTVVSD